jgi:PAS domain S-box-containing protein
MSEIEQSSAELQARIAELEACVATLEARLSAHRRVFFDSPVPTIVYSAATLDILSVNEGAADLYGFESRLMRSMNLLDLMIPGERSMADLAAGLKRLAHALGPVRQRACGGRELVVSMTLFTFDLEEADARIAIIQDETKRHQAEEALRASEERFRELFENANDFIFIHDLKGKILAVNRAGESLTGYSRQELVGECFDVIVPPEARERRQDSVRAHLGGSPTQHFELQIVTKSGMCRFLDVSTRIMHSRGHPVAIQGIGRDVTARKFTQQRLIEQARELEEKNRELSTALQLAREATQLKEQFLANTSHELRTPMNGIMGMVNLLKSTPLAPDQTEYAECISNCANDLLTIINDLLDLSQIEAGRFSISDEPFNVRDSIHSVVKLLSVRADAKKVALSENITGDLPVLVYGDSVRFRQIVTNLVANAIKFTPSGSVEIRLRMASEASRLRCEVVDTGIGVAEAARERIFEAFFQADGTPRRKFGGTGLGLTISKQLVEIMGGTIGMYNNTPGPGATFWFELPLRPAGASSAEASIDEVLPESV